MWPVDLGKGLEHIGRRRPEDGGSIYAAMKKSSLMVYKDVGEAALLSPMLLLVAPIRALQVSLIISVVPRINFGGIMLVHQ